MRYSFFCINDYIFLYLEIQPNEDIPILTRALIIKPAKSPCLKDEDFFVEYRKRVFINHSFMNDWQ